MLTRVPSRVNPSLPMRSLLSLVALTAATLVSGCANVAAYQRERLAHPTMNAAHAQSVALEHVRAVQEGAMGGELGAASGCGCN